MFGCLRGFEKRFQKLPELSCACSICKLSILTAPGFMYQALCIYMYIVARAWEQRDVQAIEFFPIVVIAVKRRSECSLRI